MILFGESIHTMSREISSAIESRNPGPIEKLARLQAELGAEYLDLNLGPLTKSPVTTAQWVVSVVQEAVDLPLSIDTSNPVAMEAALEVSRKVPIINSVPGTTEGMEKMLPLAKKYSAEVVLLTINDEGVPPDADARAEITMGMVERAERMGVPLERIWVDGVLMPICVNQHQVGQYVEFIQMVQDIAPGVKTLTGLSNVSSCGTPPQLRHLLNQTLFTILDRYGQTGLIANVQDLELLQLKRGERPELVELIYTAQDGSDIDLKNVSEQEMAYVKTVDVLMGRKLYSHCWLETQFDGAEHEL